MFARIEGGYGKGERYRITHPVESVNGILRGSFYVTVGESTVVTCDTWDGEGEVEGRERLRAVIEYKEEVSGMPLKSFYFLLIEFDLVDSRG